MRDEDDDALAGIDLAAWQPPAPRADLADAVIARLREPPAVVAVEPVAPRSARRAWWLAGFAAAAASVTGVMLATREVTRAPRAGRGELAATTARHLELDGTTADLDPGAAVRWTRARHLLTALQARGTVRWTVAADDTLTIEPGGPSTVTIEATGASLRVEAPMNFSDVRLLGVSGVTAAAVAVATVAVYSGHVRATSGGQTVTVTPGATVELRADQPPRPPAPVVGASNAELEARVIKLAEEARLARQRVAELEAQLAARTVAPQPQPGPAPAIQPAPPPAPSPPATIPPTQLEQLRIAGDKRIVPDSTADRALAVSGAKPLGGAFKLCIDATGAVTTVTRLKSTGLDAYDQQIEATVRRDWRYKPFVVDGQPTAACTAVTFGYTPSATSPAPTATARRCDSMDADDMMSQAANQYTNGYAGPAVRLMRKALECRQDLRMFQLTAMYACGARDLTTAREFFAKLPPQQQAGIDQRCQQEGLDVRGR